MRFARVLAVLLALLAQPGFARPASASERLTVYAASSMQEALLDIARAFHSRHEGIEIEFSFGGTSTLRTQITHGAPADVFVPADSLHAAALHRSKKTGVPVRFATSQMVVVTRRGWIVPPASLDLAQKLRSGFGGAPTGGDSPSGAAGTVADRTDLGRVRNLLKSLTRPGARIVLADSTVPAGRYARRAIERMAADPLLGAAFGAAIEENVASLETNVRSVLAKVALGEADAGIVYGTDVHAARTPIGVTRLPSEYAVEAGYFAAVVSGSKHARTADAFVAFLGSDYARSILRRHGFGP